MDDRIQQTSPSLLRVNLDFVFRLVAEAKGFIFGVDRRPIEAPFAPEDFGRFDSPHGLRKLNREPPPVLGERAGNRLKPLV